jgi:hypothetical protein
MKKYYLNICNSNIYIVFLSKKTGQMPKAITLYKLNLKSSLT